MMGSPDLCGSKGQSTLSGRFVLPPSLKTAQRSRQRQENELDSLKSTREDACAPVGRLRSEDRPVRPLASSSSVGHDQRTKMTNEGDVLGLVRLRYPLSVRFDFGYNRHILERGCEGEVPLATCGILLHSIVASTVASLRYQQAKVQWRIGGPAAAGFPLEGGCTSSVEREK